MARPMVKANDRFGALMVQANFITQAELDAALKKQASEDSPRKLGEILLEMGVCTEREIQLVMETQSHLRNGGLDLVEMMERASCPEESRAEVDEIATISGNLAKKLKR